MQGVNSKKISWLLRVVVFSEIQCPESFPEPTWSIWVSWPLIPAVLKKLQSVWKWVWFGPQFGKLEQAKIPLYLWEIFESKWNSATVENSHIFFPQRFEKVLWSVLLFPSLPDSSRSHSSWCATQEIAFVGGGGVFIFPGGPWLWFCFWMFSVCSKLEGSKFSVCCLPAISCWEHLVTKWVPNILKHTCDSNTHTCLHLPQKQRCWLLVLGVFSPIVEIMYLQRPSLDI